ncbi:hypothetical protein V8C35DRAFT_282148 [Trichoderma chlorosporum]
MGSGAFEQINNYSDEQHVPYEKKPSIMVSGGSCIVQMATKKTGTGIGTGNNKKSLLHAQKTYILDNGDNMDAVGRAFKAEAKVLRHAQHNHDIEPVDAFELSEEGEKPRLAIVMSREENNVKDYLAGKKKDHKQPRQCSTAWLVSCIAFMALVFANRDSKPTNIFVSK